MNQKMYFGKTYAQKPPINAHVDLHKAGLGLTFGQSFSSLHLQAAKTFGSLPKMRRAHSAFFYSTEQ